MLYGRAAEQGAIDRLLAGLPAGRPGTLVVRGEAGIGKSALLDHAAGAPAQVLRVTGVESEAGLPFAALHLLLRPVLDRVDTLPEQQAAALLGALGLSGTNRGDRFLVGLATLSLLVELSVQEPLVCVMDDAQWLDRESADALTFAARRLYGEPVAMVFAARTGPQFPGTGLPELRLGALSDAAARSLLAERAGTLPPAVREQLVAEARGNPLALVELPAMLTAEQRLGVPAPLSFCLESAEPVTDRVLAGFRERVAALPEPARRCLLVAALDDRGELGVLTHALGLLGASLVDAAQAERAGLVRITPYGVAFRHPLVRAAVLLACDIATRMDAHRALAEAVDDDRRAWHLAAVTLQPDERVAGELERLAVRARQRGGQAAVSAAYARAAELSPDGRDAARRYTAAARSATEAGLRDRAVELVDRARRASESSVPEGSVRAQLAEVRAKLAFEAGRPLEATRLLLDGAEAGPDRLTRLSLLGLASYCTWSSAAHPDQAGLARRAEELTPGGNGAADAVRSINHDFRTVLEGGTSFLGTSSLGLGAEPLPFELRMILSFQASLRADRDGMLAGADELVRECRTEGRLGRMPQAMVVLAIARLLAGRHPDARATAAEGLALAADVDQSMWGGYLAGVHAWLSAVAGDEERYRSMAAEALRRSDALAWMPGRWWSDYAGVLWDVCAGRYEAVLDRVDRAAAGPTRHAFLWTYVWPDYVEAAARSGEPRRGAEALRRYEAWAGATGRPGPEAVLNRVRALLAPDDRARPLYEKALELHRRHEQPFDHARTRLVYGEWLRRQQRRNEARSHLEAAKDAFERSGASPWSARAVGELRAVGVSVPDDGSGHPLAALTAQELRVVELAVTGATNREIAAQLFLSPRTVAHHLYKAFPKLGVTSRAELAGLVDRRRA
ncbi:MULTISPECIES: ATP-binding protein [Streptomyces]|uniref:AAA family ATPase n=2 Tax=Streptomyces TaxID=1883 RepID=A0ABU4KJF6_9ACTN|nr:AAA family ATPase [Streptomyces roseolus]MDX2297415.1 AAA family ATPase [Streptomyces roseolus]